MFGTQHFWLFVVSGLLLNITPGQDTLYIVTRSVAQGRAAGLWSVLGISTGSVVHTLAAAFGLSAILATSANAFTVVKFAGAAYLVYLGAKMLLERAPAPDASPIVVPAHDRAWAIYRAGLLTNVLNPKVALFFLAFLPQFVAPDAGSRVAAFLFLGAVFVFNGTLWCLVLVMGASALSGRLRRNASGARRLRQATGAVFVGLGARLALQK
ncbi:MAG TPA: LysE family translocator [Vicinamibacterales bacterium]|jgi:threonine/homoserine/homoserine lactone efflux protein|nr:LysE family translocator [Vicinamibacterales bacterium]